jgi:uncharacterized protein YcbK (DUF882 family)
LDGSLSGPVLVIKGGFAAFGINIAYEFGRLDLRAYNDIYTEFVRQRCRTGPMGEEMLQYHRRDFLKLSVSVLGTMLLPMPALAAILDNLDSRRSLSFYNTHTGEKLQTCYYDQGNYRPEALAQVNHIMRDHRCGSVKAIDPRLLDQLFALKCRIHPRTPFHIISGYRTPETNEKLRRRSSGVARTSLHTMGKAIDIRLPHYGTDRLAKVCIGLKAGGVGRYPASGFVHIDTGRVRTW